MLKEQGNDTTSACSLPNTVGRKQRRDKHKDREAGEAIVWQLLSWLAVHLLLSLKIDDIYKQEMLRSTQGKRRAVYAGHWRKEGQDSRKAC